MTRATPPPIPGDAARAPTAPPVAPLPLITVPVRAQRYVLTQRALAWARLITEDLDLSPEDAVLWVIDSALDNAEDMAADDGLDDNPFPATRLARP